MTRTLLALVAVLLALLAAQSWRLHREQLLAADTATRHAQAITAATQAARTEETRRVTALAQIVNDQAARAVAAKADAGRAAAAARSLRERAQAVARGGAAGNTTAAGQRDAATAAGLVLADVLGRADDVAGELAQALDRAHGAGVTCQQSYGALTGPGGR